MMVVEFGEEAIVHVFPFHYIMKRIKNLKSTFVLTKIKLEPDILTVVYSI